MTIDERPANDGDLVLVLTASGKTGRRVADRLEARGVPIRRGSRSAEIPFDWNDPATWGPALDGVRAAYVVYTPDLAVPAAPPAIRDFTRLAARSGVRKLVLLSGRGEEEAQRCEQIVQDSGLDWTIVRASWFNQNFSEGAFLDGRNAYLTDGVQRALGRAPRDFRDYARDVAATGLWNAPQGGNLT